MDASQFTTETLRAAWHACRRPAWPADYAACMADPLISRMIMLYALHGKPQQRVNVRQTYHRQKPRASQTTGAIDLKRRASGEREDD